MSTIDLRQRYPGYPAFDARPRDLRTARQELKALLEIEADRIRNMLRFLGIDDGTILDRPGSLTRTYAQAALRACELFPTPRYSFAGYGPRAVDHGAGRVAITDTGRELTTEGEYLAADLAMLFARCLIERDPSLRWQVLTRPKSEVSYLLPVVMGTDERFHCDPFRVVGTIATGLVGGTGTCEDFLTALNTWTEILRGSPEQAHLRRQLVDLQVPRQSKARRT